MDKLLVLDGNSVLHRAYYALPDWRNRSGEATAGVYGFLAMLTKAIEELKPTHLAIVFDNPAPTFRHTMYVGYQTNREKDRQVSEDIWGQVEKLKEVFEVLKVPVFCVEGFEADDLAGTIATQASNPKSSLGFARDKQIPMDVVIITGDKDYMQLVTDTVKLYMPTKGVTDGVVVDREKVKEKLGVWPEQVIDYKALVGDGSDNYPGVPGIGPKSAIDLISNYSNFSKIYENLDKTRDNLRKKLVEGYESGKLSYQLATIKRDSPVTFNSAQCSVPSTQDLVNTFAKMGYKSLVKRMGGDPKEVNDAQGNLFERK